MSSFDRGKKDRVPNRSFLTLSWIAPQEMQTIVARRLNGLHRSTPITSPRDLDYGQSDGQFAIAALDSHIGRISRDTQFAERGTLIFCDWLAFYLSHDVAGTKFAGRGVSVGEVSPVSPAGGS